ncbi:hypothetical protein CERSUDRAFT_138426 [Gelatoporia subvermispora B]|uniref:SNF2 family DNA-dependent ATPase n=1 Tax=Ceriporiopsis subvermispora (strain B) TaxID=914234 RepID=M2QF94_CERS8|nr:hypothetical protein CERSUDRAFT_138426 [Gelatoporia subvermispora B]
MSSMIPQTGYTTPATSPPATEDDRNEVEDSEEDKEMEQRMQSLQHLLKKADAYVTLLKQEMDKVKVRNGRRRGLDDPKSQQLSKAPVSQRKASGSKKRVREDERPDSQNSKRAKTGHDTTDSSVPGTPQESGNPANENEKEDSNTFKQPVLVTGATLKDYQLEGVAWMVGLYRNGISGILADEMGLGKTLQTISFHAFLRQRSVAPFMVVCPLSVLNNWAEEFKKFAPEIPVCMYHGSPEERAELRRQLVASMGKEDIEFQQKKLGVSPTPAPKSDADPAAGSKGKSKGKGRQTAVAKKTEEDDTLAAGPSRRSGRVVSGKKTKDGAEPSPQKPKQTRTRRSTAQVADESQPNDEDADEAPAQPEQTLPPNQKTKFPVFITTFEMVMKDRAQLSEWFWGFIVVDEGHRLKNMDCKLIREIKRIPSAARMVLTGTPLHNNLAELWALLNFVLPELFGNLEEFQEWFNLPSLQSTLAPTRSSQLIHSLHTILKPFLLRRLKSDVETSLPPKKEYVLYAPLSERQKEIYDAIVEGSLRAFLLKKADEKEEQDEEEVPLKTRLEQRRTKGNNKRTLRGRKRSYSIDGDDDEYFEKLESGELEAEEQKRKEKSAKELSREWQLKSVLKKVNNMKLQNTVMQLRKVCSHPFLFDWPVDPVTRQPVLNDELASTSGKMMILDRLLDELFERGHKVLLFSQFTTMLDIIQDWAIEFKHWPVCRIDGSTSMADRREEVHRFQNGGDAPDGPRLFLLSTRAGGLGLNLVAADTVIFYDQDWNPQMDLQAQDRAHRIGQTRPVLIFRLVSAHTIETKIMQRATEKRKLEALVIAKGKFKAPALKASRQKPETIAEMAAALLRLEGEQIDVVPDTAAGKASVISDRELDMLLDRRPEVFQDRGKGWTSESQGEEVEVEPKGRKTAFAVYEAPMDETGDMLAGMLNIEDDV